MFQVQVTLNYHPSRKGTYPSARETKLLDPGPLCTLWIINTFKRDTSEWDALVSSPWYTLNYPPSWKGTRQSEGEVHLSLIEKKLLDTGPWYTLNCRLFWKELLQVKFISVLGATLLVSGPWYTLNYYPSWKGTHPSEVHICLKLTKLLPRSVIYIQLYTSSKGTSPIMVNLCLRSKTISFRSMIYVELFSLEKKHLQVRFISVWGTKLQNIRWYHDTLVHDVLWIVPFQKDH